MTEEAGVFGSSGAWVTECQCGGRKYTVSVDPAQQERALSIIPPKPTRDQASDLELLNEDHRSAVRRVMYFINDCLMKAAIHHDEDKMHQSEAEHVREKHHWTFNKDIHTITVWDLAESVADYIATVFGRAAAGRGFEILEPTNTSISAADVLMMSTLAMIEDMGIAHVSPKPDSAPPDQPEEEVE